MRALERTNPWWLVPAVLTQVLAFLAAALRLQVLTAPSVRLGMAVAVGLELTMNGLWSMAPAAPAEGLAYGAHQLHRRGLDRSRTALVLGLEQWFTYRIIYLVAALNLLVILGSRDFPVSGPWPPIAAVTVLITLAATARLARTPVRMEHLSGVMTLIYCMRAVGLVVDFPVALLATAVAVGASSIPLLPGGIGLVEAAVPALLHWFGAPLDQALAGAVVARLTNTLLPAISGAAALWALRGVAPPGTQPELERP